MGFGQKRRKWPRMTRMARAEWNWKQELQLLCHLFRFTVLDKNMDCDCETVAEKVDWLMFTRGPITGSKRQ